ncbi:10410_t:CDS:2, partial [Gigaspora margarita]
NFDFVVSGVVVICVVIGIVVTGVVVTGVVVTALLRYWCNSADFVAVAFGVFAYDVGSTILFVPGSCFE